MSKLPQITLRQLTYFTTLAVSRTYREAAEKLNLSQPALTEQMQGLEAIIGSPLFDRSQRGLSLTGAGRSFDEDAHRILRAVEESCARTRAIGLGLAGKIRIGLTDDFIDSPLFDQMLALIDARPGIEVETHVGLSPDLIGMAAKDLIDLAILNAPLPRLPKGLRSRNLAPSRIMLLAHRDHPLATQEAIRPEDLEGEPLISFPAASTNPFALQCSKLLAEAGVEPNVSRRTTSLAVAKRMISKGYGSVLVSEFSVGLLPDDLRVVPVQSEHCWLSHVLVHPNDRLVEPALSIINALPKADASEIHQDDQPA